MVYKPVNNRLKITRCFAIVILSLLFFVPVFNLSVINAEAAKAKDISDVYVPASRNNSGGFNKENIAKLSETDAKKKIKDVADVGGASLAAEFGEIWWDINGDDFQSTLWGQKIYISGLTIGDDCEDYLTMTTSDGKLASIWTVVGGVSEALKVIGIMLVCVFFVLDLIDCVTRGQFTPDILFRSLIKLFIASLLITNINLVSTYIVDFGASFSSYIANDSTAIATSISNVWDEVSSSTGLINNMGKIVANLIPYICMWAATLIVMVLSVSRAFDIAIRAAFAPVGMADIYDGGTKSAGFRYLKKLLAVSAAGAVMLLTLRFYGTFLGSGDAGLIFKICMTFALISIMGKATSFANEIFGV